MTGYAEMMFEFSMLEYDELLKIAREAADSLMPLCRRLDEKNGGMLLMSYILLSAVASDGRLTVKEQKMLSDLFCIERGELETFVSMYDSGTEAIVDKLADSLRDETKEDIVRLCCAVCSCDEAISREETAFLRRLID